MRIGVDLGGTKIEALAMDDAGLELQRIRVGTPKGDYQGTVDAIAGLVRQIEAAQGVQATVGVGIPGTVVRSTGLVKNANSTWLIGKPLEKDLSEALGREVRCANDANCFAISEATDGAAAGYDVVFGVIIGTGCGGGVAINGEIAAGPNGLRGEWGHAPLPWQTAEEFPGPDCYCGRKGCTEKWISGTGFEEDFKRVTGKDWRGSEIVTAAQAGDAESVAALDRLEDRLARSLAMLVNILDPDAIVLGGGLSKLDFLYTGNLQQRVGEYTFGKGCEAPILRNLHGDSSGVRGAAWLWPMVK
ncbi:MAG: ROK family protein [Acidobacteriaceae bacterium]|nr:ROK family protein [Acidobacteriaceae bacterium]